MFFISVLFNFLQRKIRWEQWYLSCMYYSHYELSIRAIYDSRRKMGLEILGVKTVKLFSQNCQVKHAADHAFKANENEFIEDFLCWLKRISAIQSAKNCKCVEPFLPVLCSARPIWLFHIYIVQNQSFNSAFKNSNRRFSIHSKLQCLAKARNTLHWSSYQVHPVMP